MADRCGVAAAVHGVNRVPVEDIENVAADREGHRVVDAGQDQARSADSAIGAPYAAFSVVEVEKTVIPDAPP